MDKNSDEILHYEFRDGRNILEQTRRLLDSLDREDIDQATEEDFVIIQALLQVVRAAKRKGYSEDLLVTYLRSLFDSPPAE